MERIEWVTEFLPRERSVDLLADCDLVVLPYQASKEAASGALRIALSAGVPVAVTPLPLFEEATAATIRLSGTDSGTIAPDLRGVLKDQRLRLCTQEAARAWLTDRDWGATARRLYDMLAGLHASATGIC